MALNLQAVLDAPVIEVDTIDSTNNYAMSLINADTAQAGMTIIAKTQTGGKGQRGRVWQDAHGQSLLMSIITAPRYTLDAQFAFNASIALGIVDVLESYFDNCRIQIKWPNDIIVNDKKAGGVLVENIIRGSMWQYSIVGFGLNVLQEHMPEGLPYSTSLRQASRRAIDMKTLTQDLRKHIIQNAHTYNNVAEVLNRYNSYLYRVGMWQTFSINGSVFSARIDGVTEDGLLRLILDDGTVRTYMHGELTWEWGR